MKANLVKALIKNREQEILRIHGFNDRLSYIISYVFRKDIEMTKREIDMAVRTSLEATLNFQSHAEESHYILSALESMQSPEFFCSTYKDNEDIDIEECVDALGYIYSICNK